MCRNATSDVLRTSRWRPRRRSAVWRRRGVLGGLSLLALVLCSNSSAAAATAPSVHTPPEGRNRALSSSVETLQATSSSFDLILSPAAAAAASSGGSSTDANANANSNQNRNRKARRKGGYSMKKETSELLEAAIASTIMSSGRCEAQDSTSGSASSSSSSSYYNSTSAWLGSCPYQSMVVAMERAEWTDPDDPLTIRFYVVATIRTDSDYAEKRSQSSTFDLREELDAFVLDYFYGDLFLSTVLASWTDDQDQDEDEVLTRAMMSSVELQVSENQSRIYQTRTPSASVVLLALALVVSLFVVDGVVRYMTPVQLCASRGRDAAADADDGSVERQRLNGYGAGEIA